MRRVIATWNSLNWFGNCLFLFPQSQSQFPGSWLLPGLRVFRRVFTGQLLIEEQEQPKLVKPV